MIKLWLVLILVAVYLGWSAFRVDNRKPPVLDQDEWWGPSALKDKQDTSIRPFKINFTDEMIKDLKSRLKNYRSAPEPLEGIAFEYGFNSKEMDGWVKYWAEEYPFKEREAFLNQYPQYVTNIQGLDIHFIRVKPQVEPGVEIIPLLMLHGWPGSVREFYEVIPLLTKPIPGYNFAFEVIAPSLPGFGFSDPAVRPGLGAPQIAVVFKNLMRRLGFEKFYIQGGDWGAIICSHIATLYPDDILGHHSNLAAVQTKQAIGTLILGSIFPSLVVEDKVADRIYPLSTYFSAFILESGYYHIQATKPDTVGIGLTDSPAGLLAYILEKFSTGTRKEFRQKPDGGLGFRFKKAQLIDNLMMYWVPKKITTAMRIYAESSSQKNRELNLQSYTTPVPTWALQAKNEILFQPPGILKFKYINLVGNTVLFDGGHFLALELPQVFSEDVFKGVKAIKDWRQKDKKTEL